jgi:general secretion pathway protein F
MEYRSFQVTVRKSNGILAKKQIDATDEVSAKAEGSLYGKVVRVTAINRGWLGNRIASWRRRQGFTGTGVNGWIRRYMKRDVRRQIEFLQTMSNMLVGYNVGDALSIMIQNFTGVVRDASQRLRHYIVIEQMNPEDALEKLGNNYFPKVTIAVIRSNAKVSAIHEAFREGLNFQREIIKIQSSHATAMTFSIMGFAGTMAFVLLSWVYGFEMLEDVGYFAMMPEEGAAAESLVDLMLWMDWTGWAATVIFSIWLSIILIFGAGRDINPRFVEKWILRVPILRDAMLNRRNFITTYQIQKLLSKGVNLMETFKYVGDELDDGVLKEDLDRVLMLMEKGDPEWVDGFHSFSDLDRALLKSSTHQDEMANVFKAQSDQFLSSYDQGISQLQMIHKIISGGFMLVLILVLTLLMFLPMLGGFDLVDQA